MSLLTAHKILMASAVAVFLLYALAELRSYLHDEPGAWLRGGLSALAAAGVATYLRWVWRRHPNEMPPRRGV